MKIEKENKDKIKKSCGDRASRFFKSKARICFPKCQHGIGKVFINAFVFT